MGVTEKKENGVGDITHEILDYEPNGWFEVTLSKTSNSLDGFVKKNSAAMKTIAIFILNGLVIGFFFACMYYWMNYSADPLELCYGFGSLIAFLSIIYFFIIYFLVVKKFFGQWFERTVWTKVDRISSHLWKIIIFRWVFCIAILAAIAFFLYWDTKDAPERLISLIGLCLLLIMGFVFSKHPGRINWRSVSIGLLIQFLFGVIFIRWNTGRYALQCFSNKVATFLSYGVEGAGFVFGDLLVRKEQVFAFSTLPVIFFFSMLVEVLFFWGALQWFCLKLGRLLQVATATTVCESVIAVGNVFLGMTESILLIKPYLPILTASELHVVMSSGFATVSGTILAAYIGFGAEPAHLVTASVMSAPAAICFAKLLLPETKRSLTTVENIQPIEIKDKSALSAATRGAAAGTALVLNIVANLVAFVSFIAFVNGVLGYCGGLLGNPDINLEWIFGKIFIPLSWMMGVPWEECELVGSLIGLKTVVNEFVAYQRMGEMKEAGLLSPRAELIATYALCGFTNPSSAGILIGAISAMAPNQTETLSSMAVRAFFAGCGICFMTACIAGILMPVGSFG
ncbi:solute carrier family 28 member 3-like isoform X2 [Nymphalis io]|nr:solute carrier family 28 member 3-like isoform X2 [Nymphalis io]XP_050358848.1 solute carrier family 28 member 3-like isoform X2 [Nymphalis io]XP_050358849.1 solute carrier family 28 member 3-like isoform X2 [Nymphalis io]